MLKSRKKKEEEETLGELRLLALVLSLTLNYLLLRNKSSHVIDFIIMLSRLGT